MKFKKVKERLSGSQNVVIKVALTSLQLGAGFYLSDLIRPYTLPIVVVSIGTIIFVVVQVLSEIG